MLTKDGLRLLLWLLICLACWGAIIGAAYKWGYSNGAASVVVEEVQEAPVLVLPDSAPRVR